MTNILILYYSSTGTTRALAETAAASLNNTQVRLRKVKETAPQSVIDGQPAWLAEQRAQDATPVVTPDDVEWADGIVFAFPTRFGNIPSQLAAFIDTLGGLWFQGKLANKAVTAMVTAGNAHGGQEGTLFSLYHSLMHWGAIIVVPGYTDPVIFAAGGNPYGYSHSTDKDLDETAIKAITHQTQRLAIMATKLKA